MPYPKNQLIAEIFQDIAHVLEILGENPFRVRAYQRASQIISGLGTDLESLHQDKDNEIEKIPGIGEDLHRKIVEILETGKCEMHESLISKIPAGLLDMLKLRGLGPKKIKLFYESLKIQDLAGLKKAAEEGRLADLPGMGEKSQGAILEALSNESFTKERIPYETALIHAKQYMDYLKKTPWVKHIDFAGSLRRKAKSIGDIDLLVATDHQAELSEHFVRFSDVKQILSQGPTKSSVLLEGNVQVDLRVVPEENYGAALLYFTGSKDFNIQMRTLALKKGLKINEYGLFRGEKNLASHSEKAVFEALGMEYLDPENRK